MNPTFKPGDSVYCKVKYRGRGIVVNRRPRDVKRFPNTISVVWENGKRSNVDSSLIELGGQVFTTSLRDDPPTYKPAPVLKTSEILAADPPLTPDERVIKLIIEVRSAPAHVV